MKKSIVLLSFITLAAAGFCQGNKTDAQASQKPKVEAKQEQKKESKKAAKPAKKVETKKDETKKAEVKK